MAMSALPGPASGAPGGRDDRVRVLVEHEDGAVQCAAERILREAGYDTATCGGPTTFRRARCPVVTTGRCPLADDADVIVHALNPDRPRNADVLNALRARYPEVPIVVEVPDPALGHLADLLAGCHTLRFPMTRQSLLQAVEEVLGDDGPFGMVRQPVIAPLAEEEP